MRPFYFVTLTYDTDILYGDVWKGLVSTPDGLMQINANHIIGERLMTRQIKGGRYMRPDGRCCACQCRWLGLLIMLAINDDETGSGRKVHVSDRTRG